MKRVLTILASLCALVSCTSGGSIYNVMDFGAKGDGVTDDAAAIQKAIDKCHGNGGGQLLFPAGKTFLSGPLELKSNIDYHFQPNSVLLANPDESIYNMSAFFDNRGEGMLWIYANDAQNISISGTGAIDGNGVAFMGPELEDSYVLKELADPSFDPRPHVITLFGCNKVNITDVTIRNGAYWTVHLVGCYDVAISNISLLNKLKIRNGDGIDVDHSRKVRISNCFIESGDDCICLKNRREYEKYGVCEDIVVSNCVMTSRSCAIKIGSENMDSIADVLFNNCIIRAGNRGIGIQNRDEGTVRNVVFSNMYVESLLFSDVWWGKAEPIYVTSYPRATSNHKDGNWRFPKGATEGSCGEVCDIRFINVFCDAANGAFIGGDTPDKVHDIYFNNVDIRLKEKTADVYDKRPCKGEGFVFTKSQPLYVESATNVFVDGKKIR